MATIEGKEARVWTDRYVKKAGKFENVAKAVRALVKKAAPGSEEYVLDKWGRLDPFSCYYAYRSGLSRSPFHPVGVHI
jgi:hypothetical protein